MENKVDLDLKRTVSEYAMAFDLLAKVTHSSTEKEAIENILEICTTLFSPQKVFYLSIKEGQPDQIYSPLLLTEEKIDIKTRLFSYNTSYGWTESKKGFQAQISYDNKILGILEVDDLIYPEYKDHYLNLTISMTDVYSLAIENATRYQRIKTAERKARQEKAKLEKAMAEINQLSGLLPICSYCKKIREDSGYWSQIEDYISHHSEARFSHSICQECAKIHYPDYEIYDE
ncbi:MAG: hypothetical protein GY699_16790 [Desulfobacteraceae bacterium]|nr:hypothetical protein [Desulfobacteraceae bacterium]